VGQELAWGVGRGRTFLKTGGEVQDVSLEGTSQVLTVFGTEEGIIRMRFQTCFGVRVG
jgi:hypothetical protein